MATEIRVPTLGESVTEAQIGEWAKQPGDAVKAGETLVTLETDKVALDVPAPADGTMGEIVAAEGETVGVDALLGQLEGAGGGSVQPAPVPAPDKAPSKADAEAKASDGEGAKDPGQYKIEPGNPAPSMAEGDSGVVDILVPEAGESVTEAEVGEWFKQVGDEIRVDEALVELETDKAAQDVMAQDAGTIEEIIAQTGEVVQVGAVLARVRVSGSAKASANGDAGNGAAQSPADPGTTNDGAQGYGGANAPAGADAPAGPGTPETGDPGSSAGASSDQGASYAPGSVPGDMPPSPSASRLLAENSMSSSSVEGSGKRGSGAERRRARRDRRRSYVQSKVRTRSASETRSNTLERERRASRGTRAHVAPAPDHRAPPEGCAGHGRHAHHLQRGGHGAGHGACRKSYKDLFEKKHGVKLGFMGFFAKAVTHALKEIPAVNAEIDGTDIVYKNFAHLGVAVGTDKGLVVPVVRDADEMSIAEIEKEIGRLGRAARDGKLSMADMQGGTFTLSNGGVYGSLMSTPILNAPQSGILGMHKIQERPMAVDGQVVIRPMMYLALSYDHRIVDGKEAVTFLVRVKESLEDPQRLVLDL